MRQAIAFRCDQCKEPGDVEAHPGDLTCPHCAAPVGKINSLEALFDHCPICQCRQFYLSKDFNRTLGCFILAISIVCVPFTYGLSLPFFAMIDWALYKRVPMIVNCYQCGSLFRGLEVPKHFKPFSHPTGMQYKRFHK